MIRPYYAMFAHGRQREVDLLAYASCVGYFLMRPHYYADADADSLSIELRAEPGAETREIVDGLNVDFDARGEFVGFDLDFASKRFDLSQLETIALPIKKTAAE